MKDASWISKKRKLRNDFMLKENVAWGSLGSWAATIMLSCFCPDSGTLRSLWSRTFSEGHKCIQAKAKGPGNGSSKIGQLLSLPAVRFPPKLSLQRHLCIGWPTKGCRGHWAHLIGIASANDCMPKSVLAHRRLADLNAERYLSKCRWPFFKLFSPGNAGAAALCSRPRQLRNVCHGCARKCHLPAQLPFALVRLARARCCAAPHALRDLQSFDRQLPQERRAVTFC